MKPWSHDAGDLNPEEIPRAYIYKNPIIEEYLESGSHERKLFLIGSKGCGKTLLLRYKAFLYRRKMDSDEQEGQAASASNELVEGLAFNLVTLSRNDLELLANTGSWVKIWNFALALIILRRTRIGLPERYEYLDEDFPADFRLNNIITELINNSPKYISSNFFNCTNSLMARLNRLQSPFVLFVDRLDQALNDLLIHEEYKYLQNEKGVTIPFRIWQCAQYGLLESSYNFSTAINRHIKIFVTAREEALKVESQLRQNITSFCTYLDYNREELREIFENNIRLTPKKYLQAGQDDLYHRFLGFNEMPHIKARDGNKERLREHTFDFLLRHTFARPREIILLGRRIYEQLITRGGYWQQDEDNKIESVRRVVNDTSHDRILKDYLTEVVPAFQHEYLDECAKAFEQNLIHHNELEQVGPDITNYLYRIGLIGYERNARQVFLPASKHIHDEMERIPKASYYMLHPSLDGRLQQIRTYEEFYNDYNIIGNSYAFYPPPLFSSKKVRDRDVSFFLPARIPGNGSDKEKWHRANILADPVKMFEDFFITSSDSEFVRSRDQRINEACKTLTVVANLLFLDKVRSRFRDNFNGWEQNLQDQLSALRGQTEYSRTIDQVDAEGLNILRVRLYGRIVCAGMLAFLKPDYGTVHHILNNFTYVHGHPAYAEDTAVRYLRNAFFLANLHNSAPRERVEQEEVLAGLSPFEKDLLKRWWVQYIHHDLLVNSHLKEEHKSFLKGELGMPG